MTPYFAVKHPLDPAAPGFDWWAWRLQRRFMIDRLRALAHAEQGSMSLRLAQCAVALETETFGERDAEALATYTRIWYASELQWPRDLLLVLTEITKQKGIPVQMHWKLPVIRPTWDETPFNRVAFAGMVSGIRMQAKLADTTTLVPAYGLTWLDAEGRESALPAIRSATAGKNLPFAPAVWDWLFARRLTLLCHLGAAPWPVPGDGPLVLDAAAWKLPSRPI